MTDQPSPMDDAPTEPPIPVSQRATVQADRRVSVPKPSELEPLFPTLEVIELIGQGGMGLVYKARQRKLDRLVALKLLPREASERPGFSDRFTREAQAMARLNHPHIITVHDSGEVDGLFHLVMEFVQGSNLRAIISRGPVPPEEAVTVARQVCEALAYAHDEGVVHRDIKPENVLLDSRGRVKIADFGLAKLLDRKGTDLALTGTQQAMGTPHYMAPEQTERPLDVDHRADLYAVGVLLYELLTGGLPIGRFPVPSEQAGTDRRLDAIVLRLLDKEPDRRYQSADEVTTALSDVAGAAGSASAPAEPPIVARRAGSSTIVATSLSSSMGTPTGVAAPTPAPTPAPRTSIDGRPVSVERGLEAVRRPASLLLMVSVGSFLLHGAGVIVFVILLFAGVSSEDLMGGLAITSGVGAIVALAIVYAAQRMQRLESRWLVVAGCVAAILPLAPGCWMPFHALAGVWALMRVSRADVVEAFRLRRETPRSG